MNSALVTPTATSHAPQLMTHRTATLAADEDTAIGNYMQRKHGDIAHRLTELPACLAAAAV